MAIEEYVRSSLNKSYSIALLYFLDKSMLIPIDTFVGLCVVCEQPMGNPMMLNITRPEALMQYYDMNISFKLKRIVTRVTYRYGSKRSIMGIDPNKYFTKHFDRYLNYIASYLKQFLCLSFKNQLIEFRSFP